MIDIEQIKAPEMVDSPAVDLQFRCRPESAAIKHVEAYTMVIGRRLLLTMRLHSSSAPIRHLQHPSQDMPMMHPEPLSRRAITPERADSSSQSSSYQYNSGNTIITSTNSVYSCRMLNKML